MKIAANTQRRSIIKKGLEQLRCKLLDISGRNPLISFKHSERSKGQIQAIHTPLEAIYTALKEDKEVIFKELPEPQADVLLQITPTDHAVSLELDPSYDLQLGYNGAKEELAIQTLLFPDKFLKKMTGFLDVQKQFIDETGVNCMHACFGFLEWYESHSSKYKIISPLLMVPVYLERQYKRQQSIFLLNSSGEEVRDNPALNERLKKDFGLQLPEVTESTTLQKYFSELEISIKNQPRWRIQQRLTIGRVSFSKILMYYDLDPSNWPEEDPIYDQPLIEDFFVGSEAPVSAGFSIDHHHDETDDASPVPLIISDLDSSQLSAVSDAMNNKSFVIEGPPGTGKSQTITNIIAAAMTVGKSVLFVAEKLVALQVVKNRLDAAGLGQFCLELHSTKVQKGKFYEELKSRLELLSNDHSRTSKKLDNAISERKAIKHQLNLYASAMEMRYGAADHTLHKYFWLFHQRRDELPIELGKHVETISLKSALHITEVELNKLKEDASQWLSLNQHVIEEFGDLKKHPWFGFNSKLTGSFQTKDLLQRINSLKDHLNSLSKLASCCETNINGLKISTLTDLERLKDQLHLLAISWQGSHATNSKVFARIRDQGDVEFLHNFCQRKRKIKMLIDDVNRYFVDLGIQNSSSVKLLIDNLSLVLDEAVREGLQQWTPLLVDKALQCEDSRELPNDIPMHDFVSMLQGASEKEQQWQECEKACKKVFVSSSTIDSELLMRLKDLQGLAKIGGFEHAHHSKWHAMYDAIHGILNNQLDSNISCFNNELLNLSQDLQEQKQLLDELSRLVNIDRISNDGYSSKLESFLSIVKSSSFFKITLLDLDFLCTEKAALRDSKEGHRKTHLMIVQNICPNWEGTFTIKTMKSLCEALVFLTETKREVLMIRSNSTCDEFNHSDLREAILKYNILRKKRIELESKLLLDIDPNSLKLAISALKKPGILSWFRGDIKFAKQLYRESSHGNVTCSIKEILVLFAQLQSYHAEHDQFVKENRYKIFLSELARLGETRLEQLSDLIDWSAIVNQILKGNDNLLVLVKCFLFESNLSIIDSFIDSINNIDFHLCLKDLSKQPPLCLIEKQIEALDKEVKDLERLRIAATEIEYRANIPFELANKVETLYGLLNRNILLVKDKKLILHERYKNLASAIDFSKQVGLRTEQDTLSINETINLMEHFKVLKEQTIKQEDILSSKRSKLKLLYELCKSAKLSSHIPLVEISSIIQKLDLLQNEMSSLSCLDIFSFINEVSDESDLAGIESACLFYMHMNKNGISHSLLRYIQDDDISNRFNELKTLLANFEGELPEAVSELDFLVKHGEIDCKIWFEKEVVKNCSVATIILKLETVFDKRELFTDWVQIRNLDNKLQLYGIKTICNHILRQKIDPNLCPVVIDCIYYQTIISSIEQEHSLINQLAYSDVNSMRQRFAEIDKQLIDLYRKLAVARIMERPVDPGIKARSRREWTGRALIELEVAKQRKHRPIRELLIKAGDAMQSLKPCFMMSPLSVVQYLAPGDLKFDLVIIDEASQVKPEDAIGALARGKQIIVVGDPKQLPPTDFWKKNGEFEEEDDEEDIGNEESILDLAATVYQPMRRLRWHYRSQHESLINFSNREFYDDNLIIFPSPNFDDGKLGLKYHYLDDAQYLRGGAKTNPIEAEQLVNSVEIFMRDCPDRSVGIVTMNVQQREFIYEMMNARFSQSTIAETYRAKWIETLEPFFVKNLENVQGDERDVIFISTLYGKEEAFSEKLNQNFGPINKANGHRRLNVLFTRAKKQIVIFSSLNPDEIRVTKDSPWGLRVFKEFLKYAKTGKIHNKTLSGREYGSEFESSVAKYLKDWGYEVDSQVGVGGYFLDLAVVHPRKPGIHMLAIECDGATYHSSRSARDRDRLRQQALERMGWTIHRIWSTDWYKNQRDVLKQLKLLLEIKSQE